MVEGIGDDARCHDPDVAIEEVRIDSEGCDERDCGRFLRKILSHSVGFFIFPEEKRGDEVEVLNCSWDYRVASAIAALAAPASKVV